MTRRSAYEQRDLKRGRTIVVADGRILDTLDERGDLVPLDQPPANRPHPVARELVDPGRRDPIGG